MRLLVVEDEPELNRLLKKRLEEAHYSVDACLTGTDALDYLAGAEYDALVLDVMLPGISGLEVLRRMRGARDATPVLLLTRGTALRTGSPAWTLARTPIW